MPKVRVIFEFNVDDDGLEDALMVDRVVEAMSESIFNGDEYIREWDYVWHFVDEEVMK